MDRVDAAAGLERNRLVRAAARFSRGLAGAAGTEAAELATEPGTGAAAGLTAGLASGWAIVVRPWSCCGSALLCRRSEET